MRSLALCAGLMVAFQTSAQTTNSWKKSSSGNWEVPGSWTLGAPSSADGFNFITNAGSKTATIDAGTPASTLTISNLTLSAPAGSTNTLSLATAGGATPLRILNGLIVDRGGFLDVSNSKLQVDSLGLVGTFIDGRLLLRDGGSIITTNVAISVGNFGPGQMTVSNGTLLTIGMGVGVNPGSSGTFTIAGGANTFGSYGLAIGFTTGTVWLTGGQLTITNGETVVGVFGSGRITVSNGTLLARSMVFGTNLTSQGTLTIAGGTVTITGSGPNDFCFGCQPETVGSLWVTGGQLLVSNTTITLGCETSFLSTNAGNGHMTVSNGEVVARDIVLATGCACLNVHNEGSLTVTGGSITLLSSTNSLRIGDKISSTGIVTLAGGQLLAPNGNVIVGNAGIAHLTIGTVGAGLSAFGPGIEAATGGSILRTKTMQVSASFTSSGTLTLLSGGTNEINTSLIIGDCGKLAIGAVEITGGSLFVTNATHTAFIEVSDGSLIVNSGTLQADILVMTNACGLFVRNGGTVNISSNNLAPLLDADGDGIANGYERSHNLNPLDAADANLDSDGDGLTNLQEFQAGTDATNSTSAFRITTVAREGNNLRVIWTTAVGKTNALQMTTGVVGNYTNNFVTIFAATNTLAGTTNFLDTGAAAGSPRFYRIRLVP